MVFNATFNTISVILWQSVLFKVQVHQHASTCGYSFAFSGQKIHIIWYILIVNRKKTLFQCFLHFYPFKYSHLIVLPIITIIKIQVIFHIRYVVYFIQFFLHLLHFKQYNSSTLLNYKMNKNKLFLCQDNLYLLFSFSVSKI